MYFVFQNSSSLCLRGTSVTPSVPPYTLTASWWPESAPAVSTAMLPAFSRAGRAASDWLGWLVGRPATGRGFIYSDIRPFVANGGNELRPHHTVKMCLDESPFFLFFRCTSLRNKSSSFQQLNNGTKENVILPLEKKTGNGTKPWNCCFNFPLVLKACSATLLTLGPVLGLDELV